MGAVGVEQQVADQPRTLGSLDLMLRHATGRPEAMAVKDDTGSLSYRQLVEHAAATAAGLRALGVEPGDRVGLWLPNSIGFVVAALGCLWLGAAFVPLSVDDPAPRLAGTIEDCDPRLIVCGGDQHRDGRAPEGRRLVELTTVLDRGEEVPERAQDPERDAYLIYTSGTTGRPKGVRTPERAFRCAIQSAAGFIGLDSTTRTLVVSPFHFDGSYGTAFPTLVAGGALVIPRREELLFLRRFFRAVLEEEITHTGFSPSYLRLLLSSPGMSELARSRLRTLGLGGEECIAADVAMLWQLAPGLRVFNRYGPTEATIEATTYEVRPSDVTSGTIPIGTPHTGVSFHLMDDGKNPIFESEAVGELYIGGDQLMKGYWRDETLTASALRADVVPGTIVYRTGDLVYRDREGRYVYVGRTDDLVKRSGVRISLGEITRVLAATPGVSRAVCLPVDRDGRLAIAAFVEAGPEVTVPSVMETARARLPTSMLPDEVFLRPALPLSSTGKVDHHRLLAAACRLPWGSTSAGSGRTAHR